MTIILFRIAFFALLAPSILCCTAREPEQPSYNSNHNLHRYVKWLKKHGRRYKGNNERGIRYGIYQSNFQYIEYINSQNLSYKLTDNKYVDLTNEEFQSFYMGYKSHGHSDSTHPINITQDLPASVDWRKKGAVTHIRDQGKCGACWAFAAVAATEGFNKIKSGNLTALSEQMLIDCDVDNGDTGCVGGIMEHAYEFVIHNGGITAADDYPYVAKEHKCNKSKAKISAVTIKEYQKVPAKDEKSLEAAVSKQPVSVAIAAGFLFQLYSHGIFTGPCGTHLNHAVTVVGYGEENGTKYWIVKNSWGKDWGEDGYMRIKRGTRGRKGKCAITMDATYPVLS
uniref:zingipain-2-like n=1 Tax=Erigeron canadensis TaxID=72917 RepID=UPI001CB9CDAB|nr:zingipain-2-like [Erigeron canadensis]